MAESTTTNVRVFAKVEDARKEQAVANKTAKSQLSCFECELGGKKLYALAASSTEAKSRVASEFGITVVNLDGGKSRSLEQIVQTTSLEQLAEIKKVLEARMKQGK